MSERTSLDANSSVSKAQQSLRIALVTETYPPEINGVATTVAQLVEGLRLGGHSIELTRPLQPGVDRPRPMRPVDGPDSSSRGASNPVASFPSFSERLTRGIAIPRYPGLRMGLPATGLLEQSWSRQRPDLVHIATEGPLGWSALRAARRLGLPLVSEFRTNFHAYSRHYGFGVMRRWVLAYLRHFHNRCAVTMVPTSGLAAELAAAGFDRLKVVARGVDASRFNPAHRSEDLRASWGAGPSDLVLIAVGRVAPEKNLELLVAAFRGIGRVRPNARLVVVGDGPGQSWMERELPQAIFAGRRLGHDLAVHYASADMLVFPSLTETFGNVTLEAMASGLAVLAFDYGAAGRAVSNGVHGWVAPYNDAASFERLAVRAAADLQEIRRLGAAGRRAAESMSWSAIVRQVSDIYGQAIELHQAGF